MEIIIGNKKLYIGDESNPDATLTYEMDDEKITVFHIKVSEKLQGKGISKLLIEKMVNFAKENNKKIIPMCYFVRVQMERKYSDMIYGNVDDLPNACTIQF